ncbi:MAG TPA: hypothetical protein VNM15_06750 [Candidatus Binatia bacterium]|nr:hypothetical protein [Candidatus Binatia bacterium]
MLSKFTAPLGAIAFAAFLFACSTVPLTGRQRLSLVPASQMLSMSDQQYGEFLKANSSAPIGRRPLSSGGWGSASNMPWNIIFESRACPTG